jgi:hypothetical protein
MIIDVNTYIGHYPFRQMKYKTAADLVYLMDKYGIDKACVSNLHATYYKDPIRGNYELLEEIKPYADRLIPFAVLNPEYNQPMLDFDKCFKELGFKGLRLFPRQNGYKLDGDASVAMLKAAGEAKIPVHLPILLEDLRGYHPLDTPTELDAEEIKRAVVKAPDTDFILSNAYFHMYAKTIEPACKERKGRIFYDIARTEPLFGSWMKELANTVGYGRLVFGTDAPLQNIPVQFIKLEYLPKTLGAAVADIEGIKYKNIAGLLGL